MTYEKLFKINTNPFRLTPSLNPEEIIWAGFPKLKEQIKERIQYSIKIPSSSLVLNWGEYGSGKTHSAIYFSSKKVLEDVTDGMDKPIPYTLNLLLPKSKNPVTDFFISIIDNMEIEELRNMFKDELGRLKKVLDLNSSNEQLNNIVFQLFNDEIESNTLKQYFYGTLSKTDLKNRLSKHGILRFLGRSDDYVKFLSLFFICLTIDQKKYSSVIFWIDEFEDIQTLSSSSRDQLNNFLRELVNNTPDRLLLFLNFTLSPIDSVEDISKHLSTAVLDRVRSRIEFKQPTLKDLKLYVSELLNNKNFRTEKIDDKYYPFTEKSIQLIEEELGMVSLRRYNEAFSILLDFAKLEKESPITAEFVEKYKSEFAGWK